MKKYVVFLLVLCLLIPWYGQAQTKQEVLHQQILSWTAELSAEDKRFSPFNTAELSYYPLDPDPTQWLVTFTNNHVEKGYMIVVGEEQSFSLLEYGLGEYILFDEKPVVSLPTDSTGRTSLYAGLQSVWLSKEGIFDAKSGEKYTTDTPVPNSTSTLSSFVEQNDKLIAVNQGGVTNRPSGAWIKPGQKISTEKDFVDSIDKGTNLTYIGHLFEESVLAPFTVLGFHQWEHDLFIELEDDGSRFVPFQHAVDLGAFYK